MHLASKINKWVHSGPYANYAEIDPITAAAIYAGTQVVGAGIKRMQSKSLVEKKKKLGLRQLKAASRLSGEEAQAMGRMKKGAEEGTMNVEKLNMQMAQPLYQQGEAQEAQAMQKITQQGLEGSIIAQEVSRKVGGDVRASIANQARQIAMDNEKTKADAERRYQESLMKRGQFLREIAMKKQGVLGGAEIGEMQSKQDFASGVYDAGAEFVNTAVGEFTPGTDFDNNLRTGQGTNAQKQLGF